VTAHEHGDMKMRILEVTIRCKVSWNWAWLY